MPQRRAGTLAQDQIFRDDWLQRRQSPASRPGPPARRRRGRPAGPHPDHRAGPAGAQLRAPDAPGRGAAEARRRGRVPRPADEPGPARPAAAADPRRGRRVRADADHRAHAPRPAAQAAGRRPAALDAGRPTATGSTPSDRAIRPGFAWTRPRRRSRVTCSPGSDEGASVCELARRLRGLGIASPPGLSGWHLSTVRGLLTNPVYTGQVFGNRLRTRPVERRRSALRPVGRGGESRRVNDPAEWIAVATVPAIVEREQFERAQERLAYNQRMARRNNRVHHYLLRGLVSCGHCRRACSGRHVWRGYDYYVCRTKTPASASSPGAHCPTRLHPGPTTGGAGLARPVRGARHAGDGRARDGAGSRRALAAAGDAGATRQPAPRQGGAAAADRAAHGSLPCWRRAAERVRAPPTGRRGRLAALDGQERDLTHDTDRQAEIAHLAAHAEAFVTAHPGCSQGVAWVGNPHR